MVCPTHVTTARLVLARAEPDHESKYRGQWLYQHAYCWLRRPDESASALHLASDAKGDVQLWDQGLAERIPVARHAAAALGCPLPAWWRAHRGAAQLSLHGAGR